MAWAATAEAPGPWLQALRARAPRHTFLEPDEWDTGATVDAVLVAGSPSRPLNGLSGLKLVQSLWAGVDGLTDLASADVPVARMVDEQMTAAMSQSALAHVLAAHLHHDDLARSQRKRCWNPPDWRPASGRTVGVLGLGHFGAPAARTLRQAGFAVRGWSARPKELRGVRTYAGDQQLAAFLAACEIAVCLLPLTERTRDLLDNRTLAMLPEGAVLINLGRGEHVVESDLIAALDTGRLRHAVLDAFRHEPLPECSPLWTHRRVTVTPHAAAPSLIESGTDVIAANLERIAYGESPHHLVDPTRHY